MITIRLEPVPSLVEVVAQADEILDEFEHARAAAIRVADARIRFKYSRATLRRTIAEHLGCQPSDVVLRQRCVRCGGPHGPIEVMHSERLSCSVSRSGSMVAVALALGTERIGVDVAGDASVDWVNEIAPVILTDSELSALPADGDAAAFAVRRAWNRKEAALKAFGVGLLVSPKAVDVSREEVWLTTLSSRPIRLWTRTAENGYVVSVAATSELPPLWTGEGWSTA